MFEKMVAAVLSATLVCALVPQMAFARTVLARSVQSAEMVLQEVAAASGGVKQVSLGGDASAAVGSDGTLWTWGSNDKGMLGSSSVGDGVPSGEALQRVASGAMMVAVGTTHMLEVGYDNRLYAWGDNAYGQLGDGTTTGGSAHRVVLDGVVYAAAGNGFSAALRYDGTLWTWGRNDYGQLGDGTMRECHTPAKVMDGVASVALGYDACVALGTDGSLWVWGSNGKGQLGRTDTQAQSYPVRPVMPGEAAGSEVVSVAAGNQTLAVLTDAGKLYMCGDNSSQQLGRGEPAGFSHELSAVEGVDGVTAVALGGSFALAVDADGKLYSWGSIASYSDQEAVLGESPSVVEGYVVAKRDPAYADPVLNARSWSLSCGSQHAALVCSDGELYCWGQNGNGQLGNKSGNSNQPVKVEGTFSDAGQVGPVDIPQAKTGLVANGENQEGVPANAAYFRTGAYMAVDPGTYTCTVCLADPETRTWSDGTRGPKVLSYKIVSKPTPPAPKSIGEASLALTGSTLVYSGGLQRPSVTVKLGGQVLAPGTDYTLSWSAYSADVGTYSVRALGRGAYMGVTQETSYTILPKGTALKSLKALKYGRTSGIVAKWGKQAAQVTGYELRLCRKASFAGSKVLSTKRYVLSSKVGKKAQLAKKLGRPWLGKRVYVQVRTYKVAGGRTYVSAWSKSKSVKTRR